MKIQHIIQENLKRLGPDENDPFEQGWFAGHHPNREDSYNPYERGSAEYKRWQNGYDEAQAQPNHYDEGVEFTDEQITENLNQWFKEKWVRFGPDGKIRGDCARGSSSEGKPKCLPRSKAHSLGKKGRASAASRKRKKDPNADRSGKAINVNTKKKTNESAAMLIKQIMNEEQALDEACWKGYHKEGNKKMFGKTYPNCVKNKKTNEEIDESDMAENKRVARKPGQPANSKKHSDLYTDENPKGTITGLKFATEKDARDSVAKIKSSGRSHAHKVQAAVAMEQRAKAAGKASEAAVYRKYINSVKKTDEQLNDSIPFNKCPKCRGDIVHESQINEAGKDACYHKVKSRYKVWPSAYASGALVKCRKAGAANWGNKSESVAEASSSAQQAAVAINMKRDNKKPKHQGVAEATGDQQFDSMMKTVTKSPTAKERNAERIRQKAERQEDSRKRSADVFGTSPADKLSIRKEGVAEAEEIEQLDEKGKGLWANIRAKQKRIKSGSGERMRKPGSKGSPSNKDLTSIRAASKNESLENKTERNQKSVEEATMSRAAKGNEKYGKEGMRALAKAGREGSSEKTLDTIRDRYNKYEKKSVKETSNYGDLDEAFNLEEEIKKLDEKSAAWQRKAGKSKSGGLNKKGVASYRRANPGSKLQTAVTTKPSKLKPGSKPAKRRKSFCARMGGMKGPMKDDNGKPTRKALALRKWNC